MAHIRTAPSAPHSAQIRVDPDNRLSSALKEVQAVNLTYAHVFHRRIHRYNGASGPIEAVVNMGPTLPPQRKGGMPQYNRATLSELQDKFDELEKAGVFAKLEQVNVTVEYLNMSLLV